MSIELKIVGDTAGEIVREVGILFAAMFNRSAEPVVMREIVQASDGGAIVSTTTETSKGRGRPRRVPAEQPQEEKKDDAVAETGAAEGASAAAEDTKSGEAVADTNAADKPAETAAEAKPLTTDDVRQHTINYLHETIEGQEARKTEFGDILKHFDVTKLADVAADRLADFKAEVDRRWAAKKAA